MYQCHWSRIAFLTILFIYWAVLCLSCGMQVLHCHLESSVAVHKLSSYGLKSQYLQHIGLVALWPVGFQFPD